MCGISGFIDFNKKSTLQQLEKMNRSMLHRGPDGEGYAQYETPQASIAFGHRRLSIIDLTEGGRQPMSFQNLHITFNGEIYNYAEIKKELEEKGHSFLSHSDTEVILHAYKEWGSNCLQKFIGMFAFVIFNEENKTIFAARDRAGVKPFFYYWHNNLFLFGSELKALMNHPGFEKNINTHAIAAFLQLGYVPTPHCIFQQTHKLKPGHFLEFYIATQQIKTTQYWSVYSAYNRSPLKIDLPEAISETEKILTNAFQYRMVSDVPVGVFLSGGFDSSCVTTLLQKNSTQKIKTFTIGVPDAGLNEAPYAKDIAQHLGTDHTEAYCTQKEALDIVPELPFYYDEPFADSSAIPTTLVSKVAGEKVTVALSADAGDEVFAGYNRYDYIMKYGKRLKKIPTFAGKTAAAIMDAVPADAIPVLNKKYLFHSRYEKLKSLLRNPSENNFLLSITKAMSDKEVAEFFKANIQTLPTALDSKELKPEFFNTLTYSMAIDYETYLLDDILQKVDRATMTASIEGREPFLDHRIIEWAAQLPIDFKYRNGEKKFILKEIVHQYIPKELMDRPKMGFGIPIAEWLASDLKKYVDRYFDEQFIQQQGIFNPHKIKQLYQSFYQGKKERAEKIWYLLMFQMWYDKWINNFSA